MQLLTRCCDLIRRQVTSRPHEQIEASQFQLLASEGLPHHAFQKVTIHRASRYAFTNYYAQPGEPLSVERCLYEEALTSRGAPRTQKDPKRAPS